MFFSFSNCETCFKRKVCHCSGLHTNVEFEKYNLKTCHRHAHLTLLPVRLVIE